MLNMNSKRHRRPNVRLGEIGDGSAAFACEVSRKDKENLVQKRWKHDFMNPNELGYNPICVSSKRKSSDLTNPDVFPRTSVDVEHNAEKRKTNALKMDLEFPNSDEMDVSRSELNFGRITKKCRLRRRRSTRSCVFGSTWNLKISSEINSEDGKECASKEAVRLMSEASFGLHRIYGVKDSSDHEISAASRGNCENGIYEVDYSGKRQGTSLQLTEEGTCSGGNDGFPQSFGECKKMEMPIPTRTDANSVRRWLEELGFGNYAGVFEMHEVDEEALPLLTFEDLKEMGVLAVGPRRKLYNAIQQLKGGT